MYKSSIELQGNLAKPMLPAVVGGDVIAWGINKSINHRVNDKFSPNLWKFLTYKNKHLTNIFQDPKDGYFYIGLRDKNNIWCGAKLMRVFCLGNKAETFSYSTSVTEKWNDVTEWFWSKYLEVGKQIYNLPEWRSVVQ